MQRFPKWYFPQSYLLHEPLSPPAFPLLQAGLLPSIGLFKDVGAQNLSPMIWQTPTLYFSPGGLGLDKENRLSRVGGVGGKRAKGRAQT